MSRVFYTSDPHLGHPKLAALRGFVTADGNPDTAAHDQWFIDLWRSVVRKRDTVYVLGDLTAGGRDRVDAALAVIASLPGRKHFIAGNHDETHPAGEGANPRAQARWLRTFDSVQPFAVRSLPISEGRVPVYLSHFPYFGDHAREDRYADFRLRDNGRWLLHGHTHFADQRLHDERMIHVGLDAWRGLVTEQQVIELITSAQLAQTQPAEAS